MNYKKTFGYVATFAVLGFTAYSIYKYVKKKEGYGDVMTLEDAQWEVEQQRNANMNAISKEFDVMIDDVRDTAGWNRSFMVDKDRVQFTTPIQERERDDVDEDEEDDIWDHTQYNNEDSETDDQDGEEDVVLKHDPNSTEARQQFIDMHLADWEAGEENYETLLKLFGFPFMPISEGDQILRTNLIDARVQFFGFDSRWVRNVSFADVILHYARLASFNCHESVRYWVDYLLEFNSLHHTMSSTEIDEVLVKLGEHTYYNERTDTYGLFGLTAEAMENAIRVATRNVENSLTYEIEFNEFLKYCIGG